MRSMVAAAIASALLGVNTTMAAEVIYREDFAPPTSPHQMMAGSLLLGRDSIWSGAVENECYVLANEMDANAVRYYFVSATQKHDLGRASVAVTVESEGRGEAYGSGILYDYDEESRRYLAFTVKDGAYLVLRRGADGMHRVAAGNVAGLDTSAPTQLVLISKDGELHFFVGRRRLVSLRYGPDTADATRATHGVGFIAFGLGRFRFDDFAVAVE